MDQHSAGVKMSLARAFTTRGRKALGGDGEGKLNKASGGSLRSKISAPTQLVSTTNMLSYNAPDIVRKASAAKISAPGQLTFATNLVSYDAPNLQKEPRTAASESSMSLRSRNSDQINEASDSPPTSPDTAFPRGSEDGAAKPTTAEASHLSSYFTVPTSATTVGAPPVPSLPKRIAPYTNRQPESLSPKSSKAERSYRNISMSERVGRKPSSSALSEQSGRSVSSKASSPYSRTSSASTSTTASSHSLGPNHVHKTSSQAPPPVPAALSLPKRSATEPFGQELAQVTELAQQFAKSAAKKTQQITTLEERELVERGLQRYSPEEYIAEISSLLSTCYGEVRHIVKTPAPQWI